MEIWLDNNAVIKYDDMVKMYEEISSFNSSPNLSIVNISCAQDLFGDEQVEEWIADGTIRFLSEEGEIVNEDPT